MAVKCHLTERSHEDLAKDLVTGKPADIEACALSVSADKTQFALTLTEIVINTVNSVQVILDLRIRVEICQDKKIRIGNRLDAKMCHGIHHGKFEILLDWSERKGTFSAAEVNQSHSLESLL